MKSKSNSFHNSRFNNIFFIIAVVATILAAFIFFSTHAAAEVSQPLHTYYTSYEIESGDTLWTITNQFQNADYPDKEDYINHIMKLNHMVDTNITAGNYLVIEYSSYEEL